MIVFGVNSWIHSAGSTRERQTLDRQSRGGRRVLRAGLAGALLTFTLATGVMQPAEISAAKSTSFTCTTLESMFNYASRAATTAELNGLTDQASKWRETSFYLQGVYLDLDCSTGSLDTAV